MILYKKENLENTKEWKDDDIYVLADFDKTLTTINSVDSWGLLSKNEEVPDGFRIKETEMYNYYRPIEISDVIPKEEKEKAMTEWYKKSIKSWEEFNINEDLINKVIKNQNQIHLRTGVKELLENLYKRNIPVIIISAGLGNIIESILKQNNCLYKNIHVESNFIQFENGYAVGIKGNTIHSLNKNEMNLDEDTKEKIIERNKILLMGDSIDDISMTQKDAIKIGFIEKEERINLYKEKYDIVCSGDTSMEEIAEIIEVLK